VGPADCLSFSRREFPKALAQVITDYEIALEAGGGCGSWYCADCRHGLPWPTDCNRAGETARAGGYGPWVGDEGSAFEIGRLAGGWLVARSRDQAGPITLLTDYDPGSA